MLPNGMAGISDIRSFIHSTESKSPHHTHSLSQAGVTTADSQFLRSSLILEIGTVVMEMVQSQFYWVYGAMFKLYRGEAAKACTVQYRTRMANLMSWPKEWRRGELTDGVKRVGCSGQRGVGKQVGLFNSTVATESNGKECMRKKLLGFPIFSWYLGPNP
jgi:hypothetical protein